MLTLSVRQANALELAADVVVLGTWTLSAKKGKTSIIDALERAFGGGGAFEKAFAKEEFTGKRDQTLVIPSLGRIAPQKVIVIGLGDRDSAGPAEIRTFAAKAARLANAERAKTATVSLPEGLETKLRIVAEGLELGAYRFTHYLSGDRKPKEALESVTLVVERKAPADAKKALAAGQAVAAGVCIARDLSNEPPNVIYPESFAAVAVKIAKEHKLKVTVIDDKEIEKRGMWLLHAVGRGSSHKPRLVHLSYVPAKKAKKKICFVGKGITFDSGGLSIKPAQGMGEMKHDMSGAANVVGLMAAIAALKPNVEVHAVAALAENMPDGNAYRPGDIWGSLDGKFVEITNTDAEGRLILADALTYAAKEIEPDLLIDNATLTGACVVALGATYSGWYASNEATATSFQSALKQAGETMWRLPLIEELREQLKSDCADLKHTGDRFGGSITAALFLREFIGKTKNWVHADIAGPSAADRPHLWHGKGATGHAVLTFLALVERASK